MGRWAQATRRSSAPPLQAVTLLSVQFVAGNTVRLTFDKPVAVVIGAISPSSSFQVVALNTSAVNSATTTSVVVGVTGVPAVGNAYSLNAQPPWLKNPAVFPLAGLVT